jgi:hypothetical protein
VGSAAWGGEGGRIAGGSGGGRGGACGESRGGACSACSPCSPWANADAGGCTSFRTRSDAIVPPHVCHHRDKKNNHRRSQRSSSPGRAGAFPSVRTFLCVWNFVTDCWGCRSLAAHQSIARGAPVCRTRRSSRSHATQRAARSSPSHAAPWLGLQANLQPPDHNKQPFLARLRSWPWPLRFSLLEVVVGMSIARRNGQKILIIAAVYLKAQIHRRRHLQQEANKNMYVHSRASPPRPASRECAPPRREH